jgi:hypothetical protein
MSYLFAAGLCLNVRDEWGHNDIDDFLRLTRWFY